jgi:hypothetical protein
MIATEFSFFFLRMAPRVLRRRKEWNKNWSAIAPLLQFLLQRWPSQSPATWALNLEQTHSVKSGPEKGTYWSLLRYSRCTDGECPLSMMHHRGIYCHELISTGFMSSPHNYGAFIFICVAYLTTLFQFFRLHSFEWKGDKWTMNWKGFGRKRS